MTAPAFDAWRSCVVAGDVAAASHAGAEALADRRARRLADLFVAAARGSRLYRRLFDGRDPAACTLDALPIMCKSDLMRQFDDWVADPELRLDALMRFTADSSRIADPFLGRYVVWESSGSSGEPGIFVQDASAMAAYDALEALRRPVLDPLARLWNPWSLRECAVFVGAIGGHFASMVSIERLRRLNPVLSGAVRCVSFLQPLEQVAAELQALAPTVITTYPSVAVLLAEEKLAGRLKVAPREVWTGGETLSDAMRRFIGQAFDCPVVNSYGASEFLVLAVECTRGSLHLNSDWAILEPVDDRGRALREGQTGATTLLTNLANHVQPLIRYDLGDSVMLKPGGCSCGSQLPVIEVQGRSDDTLRLGAGQARVAVPPLALCTVLEGDAGLFDFQLVQQGPNELLLRTGLRGDTASASLRRARGVLAGFLSQQGVRGTRIHCRSGEAGGRGRTGKAKRVIALPP